MEAVGRYLYAIHYIWGTSCISDEGKVIKGSTQPLALPLTSEAHIRTGDSLLFAQCAVPHASEVWADSACS